MKDSDNIERVQKSATKIIMGSKYDNYEESLKNLQLQRLSERRAKLCLNFAKKSVKHEKANKFFPLNQSIRKLRIKKCTK